MIGLSLTLNPSLAKVRQAQLLIAINKHEEAHDLLRASLLSQKANLNLRGALTHFLISHQLLKPAKEFVIGTLKDIDGHDVYSHCAAGWIQFHQARENRESTQKAAEERRRGFQRAAEFYERALQLDERCAFAAQGLAIITAEDALSSIKPGAPDEAMRRVQAAREALEIFGKVRESVNDANVYINIGHCFFIRDEFDRAIESVCKYHLFSSMTDSDTSTTLQYETAQKRFLAMSGGSSNVIILQSLCRAWYAKAHKDQSFSAISTAHKYAQTVQHIQPQEKVNLYNIAMIEQKALELLFAIQPAKRTLTDLLRVVEHGAHSVK